MEKPIIFIGSSSEGLLIANAIKTNLENAGDVYIWTEGIFELGSSYLESLIKELDKADFAILVLTEGDITISRGQEMESPRDNVLFELGLFMGRLGRDRAYFVYNKDKNIKLPSDLAGICGAGYKLYQSGDLIASLGTACFNIHNAINKAGIRPKSNVEHINACTKRFEFCKRITGYWWERIKPELTSVISYVNIEYDEELLVLKLKGRAYDKNAYHTATWESKVTGINFDDQRVFYQWEGWHPSTPMDTFEGVGDISFNRSSEDLIKEGYGIFSNMKIGDIKSTEKRHFDLSRCEESEVTIMTSKDKEMITALIIDKINDMP